MKYVCLIYVPADFVPTADDREALRKGYADHVEMHDEAAILARARLREAATATTVRVRGGQRLLSDGPCAEAKELLGGFYLIECADLDAALDYVTRMPIVAYGAIEVRPIVENWTPERESFRY